MATREALARLWPLFGLRLATPRLELRPMTDDDLAELVDLAAAGVHASDFMPFAVPWTDSSPEELPHVMLRYHWQERAATNPEDWSAHFAVRWDGRLIGEQELPAHGFALTRTVSTGSWLGRGFQGSGLGTEMRAAVLLFAFDWLGAQRAESGAWTDNPASLRVSEKLGYRPNGVEARPRRPGQVGEHQRLLITAETFHRPAWSLLVNGFDACRAAFAI